MTNLEHNQASGGVPRKKRRGSLFFKLMAVMTITVVLTLCILAFFFRTWWNPGVRESTRTNLRHYAELLTVEIGNPPDHTKASMLSDKLKMGISIRDPDGAWWFCPRVPDEVRARILAREHGLAPPPHPRWLPHPPGLRPPPNPPESAYVHWRKGRMLAVIPAEDGYTFVFGSRRKQPWENSVWEWLLLFGGVAGLWFLAWLFLRRQLQPVKEFARGVAAVEAGNLDARIPETGSHELAELAASFNSMTRSLKERLRARDQLLLDVSHELRSPLTRMRVALEMTEPGTAVDSLHEEVDALGKMVSEILETERLKSQAGSLLLQPVDLASLLAEKVSRFESEPPGFALKTEDLPPVLVDFERIRLVLRNLFENALKHGGQSGTPIAVTLRRDDQSAIIEVRNGGPIVPEEEQRLIFEPFYRTDRSRSGTTGYGLGLPLCKRIVEAHGGTIVFRSNPKEGTVVTVRLPLER